MLIIKNLDYSFDLKKKDFRRIEFKIEREMGECSNREQYKILIEKAREDFLNIEKFFDENFPIKNYKKEPYGTETPNYISAGYDYEAKKFISPLKFHFDCNFSSWNRTEGGFLKPYFSIKIEINEESDEAIKFFQNMVTALSLKFSSESERVFNQILKRIESRKEVTPYAMFNTPFE